MSDRSFVLAMWHNGLREWDDSFAADWAMTILELLGRGVITEGQALAAGRDMREALRRYEQLRLDGVTPTAAIELMVNDKLDSLGRPGPSAAGRQPGSTATQP